MAYKTGVNMASFFYFFLFFFIEVPVLIQDIG